MNILITGYSGFLGQKLLETLKEEHDLYLVGRTKRKGSYTWDELEDIPWDKLNIIIHLAGVAHVSKNITYNDYYQGNVESTKSIIKRLDKSRNITFIFVSSIKAVCEFSSTTIEENTHETPESNYGITKLIAEKTIIEELYDTNISHIILRPCVVLDKDNPSGNLLKIKNFIELWKFFPLGFKLNQKSVLSIDNFIYSIKTLINNNIQSGKYIICDDLLWSTSELISLLSGNKYPTNEFILNMLYRLKLHRYSEGLKKLTGKCVASNLKFKKSLNIDKMPYNYEKID